MFFQICLWLLWENFILVNMWANKPMSTFFGSPQKSEPSLCVCVWSGLGPSVWRRVQTHLLPGLPEYFLLYLHSEQPAGCLLQVLEGKCMRYFWVLIILKCYLTWANILLMCINFHRVLGVWCRWLLVALLGAQWKLPGLDWRRVHRCRQSHHLDWRRLQLHLQAARQVNLLMVSSDEINATEVEHNFTIMSRELYEHRCLDLVLNFHLLCVCVFPSCQRASEHFRSDVGKTKEGSIPPLIYSITDRSDKQVSHSLFSNQFSKLHFQASRCVMQ